MLGEETDWMTSDKNHYIRTFAGMTKLPLIRGSSIDVIRRQVLVMRLITLKLHCNFKSSSPASACNDQPRARGLRVMNLGTKRGPRPLYERHPPAWLQPRPGLDNARFNCAGEETIIRFPKTTIPRPASPSVVQRYPSNQAENCSATTGKSRLA